MFLIKLFQTLFNVHQINPNSARALPGNTTEDKQRKQARGFRPRPPEQSPRKSAFLGVERFLLKAHHRSQRLSGVKNKLKQSQKSLD